MRHRTAVLIACKNGEKTIGTTIASVAEQADVYVVSDGSTDDTALVARRAGATVIERPTSGGKPNALREGFARFRLAERYEFVAVLDDDTILDEGYVDLVVSKLDSDDGVAAASGRVDSLWTHAYRWNPLIAMRAFMYWSYQVTIKRGQNLLKVVNVICGANTIFRARVFAELIAEDPPYAIDDMYWLAELVRRRLGRVAYVHAARSWTIDPHTFGSWYRQTVRWSWGQFQSVRGHRLGFRRSWFDFAYFALLLDWLPYMIEPLAAVPVVLFLRDWIDPLWILAFYVVTSVAWIGCGAIAMRKPRLLLLAPAILVLDLVYRVTMMHALLKTLLRPRIDVCAWDSPARMTLDSGSTNG
jgi:poly-beta-1,6-N-acetyl-D-glucosamine synthase